MLSHDNSPNAFPKSLAQWRASNRTPNLPLIRRRLSQALPSPLTATHVTFRCSTTRNTSRRTIESVANLEETCAGAKQARARMRHIVFVAECNSTGALRCPKLSADDPKSTFCEHQAWSCKTCQHGEGRFGTWPYARALDSYSQLFLTQRIFV